MTKSETIWVRARAALVLTGVRGDEDVLLWEHAARVARSAILIAEFPEVSAYHPDGLVTLIAALFADAAWIMRCHAGECTRAEILTRPLSSAQREAGLKCMEQALADVAAPSLLERAGRVIRQFTDRESNLAEARIVADAENLEEVGLASLWPSVRRGATEGKGVQTVLDQWNRRKEYQFWASRLKEGFHFAASRDIAVRRLAAYERLMDELRMQQTGVDFPTRTAETPDRNDQSVTAGKVG